MKDYSILYTEIASNSVLLYFCRVLILPAEWDQFYRSHLFPCLDICVLIKDRSKCLILVCEFSLFSVVVFFPDNSTNLMPKSFST